MPALEMAQETGKLIAWRKKEGDQVIKGEPLLEVETDKAVLEVEAPADGILTGIKASAGADIPVGQTIAWIVAPGEAPPAEATVAGASAQARARTDSVPSRAAAAKPSESAAPRGSTKISPKARRLAKELGVDPSTLHGTGPGGEILAADVQAAATPSRSAPATQDDGHIEVPTSIGRLMAERTAQAWTTVPHFFVNREVDATALNAYRDGVVEKIEQRDGVHITHTDLLVALVARVLLKHPRLNASWTPEGIRLHDDVNVALAVVVEDGVVAAVIRRAHSASLAEIAKQRRDVGERARAGKLRPSDLADATFTISNLGMYKVDAFTAIITPPQAAVLAVGAIAERVVAVAGKIEVRPTMTLTLSCDHRVADGARAALFLNDVATAISAPVL